VVQICRIISNVVADAVCRQSDSSASILKNKIIVLAAGLRKKEEASGK
jgi:hypothetical protein